MEKRRQWRLELSVLLVFKVEGRQSGREESEEYGVAGDKGRCAGL